MSDTSNMANSILGNLETILRHIAPGYVAIICVRILYPEYLPYDKFTNELYFVVAPLLGFLLYFLHTSVIYRFIFVFVIVILIFFNKLLKCSWELLEWNVKPERYKWKCLDIIHKYTFKQMHLLDIQRWKRRNSTDTEDTKGKSIQKEMDK